MNYQHQPFTPAPYTGLFATIRDNLRQARNGGLLDVFAQGMANTYPGLLGGTGGNRSALRDAINVGLLGQEGPPRQQPVDFSAAMPDLFGIGMTGWHGSPHLFPPVPGVPAKELPFNSRLQGSNRAPVCWCIKCYGITVAGLGINI